MGWFRKRKAEGSELLGRWAIDPADHMAVRLLGDVTLEFNEGGSLTYIIREADRDQIIRMTYRVAGDVIITDQPSHPDPQSTRFTLSGNSLTLCFGGQASRFTRVGAA